MNTEKPKYQTGSMMNIRVPNELILAMNKIPHVNKTRTIVEALEAYLKDKKLL